MPSIFECMHYSYFGLFPPNTQYIEFIQSLYSAVPRASLLWQAGFVTLAYVWARPRQSHVGYTLLKHVISPGMTDCAFVETPHREHLFQ